MTMNNPIHANIAIKTRGVILVNYITKKETRQAGLQCILVLLDLSLDPNRRTDIDAILNAPKVYSISQTLNSFSIQYLGSLVTLISMSIFHRVYTEKINRCQHKTTSQLKKHSMSTNKVCELQYHYTTAQNSDPSTRIQSIELG